MRRAIATAAVLAAVLAPAASAGPRCPTRVAWHGARYKPVSTTARPPLGPRLEGTGVIVPCSTTRLEPGVVPRVSVYAVRGIRPQVAIAARPSRPALYVSTVTPTAAERRILERLR